MAPIRRAAPRPDFSSHPSDLELINNYLVPWVATGERPWKFIHDADVYAVGPDDLTAAYPPATASDGQEAWYFFTSLRAKSRRGKRKTRTVGSGEEGCWHSERAAKALLAGIRRSRQIGYRQSFSFATKEDGRLVRSGWLMAEIGLNYDGLGGEGSSPEEELVLCKVYRSPRVGPAPGARRSTAVASAAANGVGPEIRRGKEAEYSASSSEEGTPSAETKGKAACHRAGPAHLPSDSVSTESDSEQDSSSSSHGGCVTGASPAPRVVAGDAAARAPRTEAFQAPGNPFLASSPICRLYPAPQIAMVPSRSDAPRPDFGRHPSDQELVKAYLIPRVASGENNWKFIHDADVYGADPADLTREYSAATASDAEKAWYFFTSLPAKSVRGQRRPRTVGSGEGCWHSEAGAKAVVDGGGEIGRRQFFSFMKREDGQRVRTGWIMVEVGLNHGHEEDSSGELVLCKVYRSPRAGPEAGAIESTAAAAAAPSRRKRKADSNSSVAGTPVLAPARSAKKSTAAAATKSGRKRKAGDKNSGAEESVLGPARGAMKSTAASASASSGRKKKAGHKNSAAASPAQLCTRCRLETAESHSGTADDAAEEDETRGRSETGVLEHDSMTDESAAPHGHETGDSSGSAKPPFYHFV